jgi:hypothetical protein
LKQAVRGRDADGAGIDESWTCDSFVFHSSTKPRNYGDANPGHTAHTYLFDDDIGRGDACKTTFDFLHKNDFAAWPRHDSHPTTKSPSYLERPFVMKIRYLKET